MRAVSWILLLGLAGAAVAQSADASAAAHVRHKKKKRRKKKPRKRPTLSTKAESKRTPASVEPDLQVFDENTHFEELLEKAEVLSRAPAALSPLARVIGLRRDIPLTSREEDLPAQDIVINGGTTAGLTEGESFAVVRKLPIIDPYHENQATELEVEFARVKVVHAQSDICIARLEKLEAPSEGLSVGTRGIMVGDFVTRARH